MAVRKTESRIPDTFQAENLGQAITASGCTMISYVTSPLVNNRPNQYVVFITDAGIAASTNSYEWTVEESGVAPIISNSTVGELALEPTHSGSLRVSVRVLNGSGGELAALTLNQTVVPPSEELEDLIAESNEDAGPGMADPDALRELINQYNPYYQSVTLQQSEPIGGFKRLVFNMCFDGVMRRTEEERKRHVDQLALALNSGDSDFATLSTQGVGVCNVRLLLLAMTLPGMIPWTLMPTDANERALRLSDLHQDLARLDENKKIDLFNLARFPKSNIQVCAKMLENLRNQYFNTTNFDDVLTGMSGARAQWIIAQYRQGPITRT
jgi:hypothetical protein